MAKLQFLVPVDGSENSNTAVRHAVELACKYGADISTMFVVDNHKYRTHDLVEIVKRAGAEYVGQMRKLAEGHGVVIRSAKVLVGSPIEEILKEAKAMDVLLVIMAASGSEHVEAPFIGSVASRVLRHSSSHVLLVRETESMENYKEILIPADGSEDAMYAANAGMSLAKRYDAEVCACTVVDSKEEIIGRHVTTLKEVERGMVLGDTTIYPEAIIKRMRQRLLDEAARIAEEVRKIADENGVVAEIIVKDGKTAPEILKIVREKNVDLIVLGSRGKSSLSKRLIGAVSEKVASMAKCSVLVVRSSKSEGTLPK